MSLSNQTNIAAYQTPKAIDQYEKREDLTWVERNLLSQYCFGKILDLGCGVGRTTKYLADKGYDVIGVDIASEMIHVAKKKYPHISFEVGDASQLSFPNNSFNIVFFSFNGLDYLAPFSKRVAALKEIERVLRPGGFLIYSSHNPLALFFRFRPKFLIRNLPYLTSYYKVEKHPFGELLTFYGSPQTQKHHMHAHTRLRFIDSLSRGRRDLHPYYVFQKPLR